MTVKRFIAFALVLCLLLVSGSSVYATPLNPDAKPVPGTTPTAPGTGGYDLNASSTMPGYPEKQLVKLCNNLSAWTLKQLDQNGISIQKLVYGAPGADGNRVPILFSMDSNNVFGKVSGAIFALFRALASMALPIILTVKALEIAQGQGNQGQRKADWKNTLATYAVSILALFILPLVLPAAIDLRDSLLTGISTSTPGGMDLLTAVQKDATADGARLGDAIMYMALVGATLWFALSYTCLAMGMAVLLAIFPLTIITMNSVKIRIVLNNWCKEVSNLYFVPLIDTILLLFPTYAISMVQGSLFPIFMLMLIIPTRTLIRKLFGIGGGGMELAGVGMLMGAAALARGAVGGVRGVVDAGKEYQAHRSMSNYYSDQAEGEANLQGSSGAALTQAMKTEEKKDYGDHIGGTFEAQNQAEQEAVAYQANKMQREANSAASAGGFSARGTGDRYANSAWVHRPEMARTLSNSKLAALHKKEERNAVFRGSLGAAGGSFGALVGASMGVIGGPAGLAYGAAIGGALGSGAGQGVAGAIGMVPVGTQDNLSNKLSQAGKAILDALPDMSAADMSNTIDVPISGVPGVRDVGGTINFRPDASASNGAAVGPRMRVDMSQVMDNFKKPVSADVEASFTRTRASAYESSIQEFKVQFANQQRSAMERAGTAITPDVEKEINRKAEEFAKSSTCTSSATLDAAEKEFSARVSYMVERAKTDLNIGHGNVDISRLEQSLRDAFQKEINKHGGGGFKGSSGAGKRYEPRSTDLDVVNF